MLTEGIEILQFYEEDNPEISNELRTYVTNVRRSHTRRLLYQLVEKQNLDIEVWFQYVLLLLNKLKEEKQYLIERDPELKKKYDKFWSMHSEVLKQAIKSYEGNRL